MRFSDGQSDGSGVVTGKVDSTVPGKIKPVDEGAFGDVLKMAGIVSREDQPVYPCGCGNNQIDITDQRALAVEGSVMRKRYRQVPRRGLAVHLRAHVSYLGSPVLPYPILFTGVPFQ